LNLTSLAVDPSDHNTMYLGTANNGVYSITFTKPIASSLRVGSPNGGESWPAGTEQTIRWTYTGEISDLTIELSTDNGATFAPIATLVLQDANGYRWTVPNSVSSACYIRIKENAGTLSDTTNAVFSIAEALPPPSFSFRSLLPDSIVSGTVNLEVSGIDPSRVFFSIDGTNQGRVWDTTLFVNGLHRIIAVAFELTRALQVEAVVSVNNPNRPAQITRILPSSARAGGLGGAFYTTDVTIAHHGRVDAPFSLQFAAHDFDGSQGPTRTFNLAAGKMLTFYDVLKSVFGLENDYGAIHLATNNWDLTLQGQTSTPGAGGIFGQSVSALGSRNITSSMGNVFGKLSIAGVREDASFRTNLILANAGNSSMPLDVQVSLVAGNNQILASKIYKLMPFGMTQVTRVVRELGISLDIAAARLDLLTLTSGGAFGAYASLIDNGTNDPRTLLPSPVPELIPSTARFPGAEGAFYTTALSLFNRSTIENRVALQFLGHDGDGRAGPIHRLSLAPGASVVLSDVLKSLFDLESA